MRANDPLPAGEPGECLFVRRTVRNGEKLSSDGHIVVIGNVEEDGEVNAWGSIVAVSYTHLDVYKRQSYESVGRRVARVHCQGGVNCKNRFEPQDVDTCREAHMVGGGKKACIYRCV